MIRPPIPPWVEEPRQGSVGWIETRQIRPFVPVAMQTSQRQIIRFCQAAVLARRDVVDVKSEGKEIRGKTTILAAISRSLPNLPNDVCIHE